MALKSNSSLRIGALLHFALRFLGLNGLVAAAGGLFLWQALGYEQAGMILLIAGGAASAFALIGEVRNLIGAVASRRGAAGFNVSLQVVLATALVIGGNVFSFWHYHRCDCTRDRVFTLSATIRQQLAQLRGDTDVIVYLQHVSFGQRVDLRQDDYDQAAEKVIINKIEDLAAQFSEVGPRVRVVIWDTQKKSSKDRERKTLGVFGWREDASPEDRKHAEDMVKVIKKAPEDSIFFYTHDSKQLQRLSFNDIYQLDKKASESANSGKGNLVLIDQGVQKFANKILRVDEKKPRIAFAVSHGWLGQEGPDEYGMPGLKSALAARGFESRDIVLRKIPEFEAAALEHAESEFEVLEFQIANLRESLKEFEESLKELRKDKEYWQNKTIQEIDAEYVIARTEQGGFEPVTKKEVEELRKSQGLILLAFRVNEAFRTRWLASLTSQIEFHESEIPATRQRLDKANADQGKLRADNLAEQRQIRDVHVKFGRLLADVDLLVISRWTLINVMRQEAIPPDLYDLDDAHLKAIKEFIKSGKPVMFCLGPMIDPPGRRPPTPPKEDGLEKLLEDFRIVMPNQAVLFNVEADAMADRDLRDQMRGKSVEIPPAELEWHIPKGNPLLAELDIHAAPAVRSSLQLTSRGLADRGREGLKIRHPRPVFLLSNTWPADAVASAFGALAQPWPLGPGGAITSLRLQLSKRFDEKAVFLMTSPESWNEDRPFPNPKDRYKPRFVRAKAGDQEKHTLQERRRGPFPIGVAVEADVPAEWYAKDLEKKSSKVRLAVLGHGGIFVGDKDKLSPLREKLFLDVANWLLGRENLLAQEASVWQYPRVEISTEEKNLWTWGARLGLPLVFVYFGFTMSLFRRMR